jgi:hypothetical protein
MASSKPTIVVLGSAVVDLVLNPEVLPRPGLTVLAPAYQLLPGGKGSNQAFAAAKVGYPNVEFVGAMGRADTLHHLCVLCVQSCGRRHQLDDTQYGPRNQSDTGEWE